MVALVGERSLVLDVDGPVAWLRLNRPDAMNALNVQLLHELDSALDTIAASDQVRVVVVTGNGRAFCAGADLKESSNESGEVDPRALVKFVSSAGRTINRLTEIPQPVIAAVNGLALAGGLEIVLACDIVVAAQGARLGDAHANYGLLPGAGGATRMARVVGPNVAKYLAFTGRSLPASELVSPGLVNEVVADAELMTRVGALAAEIAGKSPIGLARMKRLIDDSLEQPLATALRLELAALEAQAHSSDLREGLAAFRQKRTPDFPGN